MKSSRYPAKLSERDRKFFEVFVVAKIMVGGTQAGDEVEQTRVYATDAPNIARDVRRWCAERGDDPRLRIALCGYAGEGHEELEMLGWTPHRWRAHGGYGGGRNGTGELNRHRETVWFSPHCLAERAPTLFDVMPAAQGELAA